MAFLLEDHAGLDVHAEAARFETTSLEETLKWTWDTFGTRAQIGTSYQGSGLVIIHHARKLGFPRVHPRYRLAFPGDL